MNSVEKIIIFVSINIFLGIVLCRTVTATIVFSISNPVIDTDDVVEVDATISGLISSSCSTSGCYLQGEFQSAGGYFCYTYNNSGEYVDYFKTPGSTDEIKSKLFNFIPVAGAWSGKLKAKNNSQDKNYYGPGDYLLIFRRFSGNSTNPTSGDSNSLSVSLTAATPAPTPSDSPSPTDSPTPSPTTYVLKTPAPTNSSISISTQTPVKTSMPSLPKTPLSNPLATNNISTGSGDTSDILGIQDKATPLDLAATESGAGNNKFPIPAVLCVFLGMGFIGLSIFSIIRNVKKNSEVP